MTADRTILRMKYARIIALVATMRQCSVEHAMELFYSSRTFKEISEGFSDLYTMSDKYLAEEIIREEQ